jgi:hypothetical protein
LFQTTDTYLPGLALGRSENSDPYLTASKPLRKHHQTGIQFLAAALVCCERAVWYDQLIAQQSHQASSKMLVAFDV